MTRPEAFIFDLNGTLIDDMEYHNAAWYAILNHDLKAGLTKEQVKQQMYGKNEELLERVFGKGRFDKQEIDEISMRKERAYQQAFRPRLQLIAGASDFLERARLARIRMGIGTAAIPYNVDFVLDNLGIRDYFGSIVSADDVEKSKPDPETCLRAAHGLDAVAAACVVFEDAPKGVEAARRAGMSCIVLTTMHGKDEFGQFPNVLGYIADYTDPSLGELF
ncbi:MAG TPA: HAD family phosphatase [Puia sp.]|nr:HAD family phosphatase [Puia sp.]